MPPSGDVSMLPTSVDPALYTTPATKKGSDSLSPEQAIGSSPLIREHQNSPLHFLNEKARVSQASSFRLSKDVANLRWDGSELREDDLREEDEEEDADFGGHGLPGDFEADSSDSEDEDRIRGDASAANHSTLSKRADFILAHAKKKLNLLEGNLGKARHSLTSPQPSSEPRSASSLSNYATPMVSDATEDSTAPVRISPRINFGTPRHLRTSQSRQTNSGHSRMFSETSVPSPGGAMVKGSRSLELMQNGDLREHAMKEETGNAGTLNTVAEDEEADRGSTIHSLRELYGTSSPPPKSTQELRDQAEELRNRIAFLQKRSRDDVARGDISRKNSTAERNDLAFISQVEALERSLEDQEEVIAQLENAEKLKPMAKEDPREEWQQVLEKRDETSSFSDDEYDDEYDELSEVFPNVLGDDDVDETKSMAVAHEDREDVFDYEHFILHSAMGRGIGGASSLDGSETEGSDQQSNGSIATERGVAPTFEEDQTTGGQRQRRSWDELQQANDSMASLTTTQSFETANEDVNSDIGSDTSDQPQEDILQTGLRGAWPMPPKRNSEDGQRTMFRDSEVPTSTTQRTMFRDSEVPTPTATAFPRNIAETEDRGVQYTGAARLSRSIFDLLVAQDGLSEQGRPLDASDGDLIRACVLSLRMVCQEAVHPSTGPQDLKAIRERLQVAKRVLNGEL